MDTEPRKRGPAPKSAATKQGCAVAVKLTTAELADVRAVASSLHLPPATWARAVLLQATLERLAGLSTPT